MSIKAIEQAQYQFAPKDDFFKLLRVKSLLSTLHQLLRAVAIATFSQVAIAHMCLDNAQCAQCANIFIGRLCTSSKLMEGPSPIARDNSSGCDGYPKMHLSAHVGNSKDSQEAQEATRKRK